MHVVHARIRVDADGTISGKAPQGEFPCLRRRQVDDEGDREQALDHVEAQALCDHHRRRGGHAGSDGQLQGGNDGREIHAADYTPRIGRASPSEDADGDAKSS